MLKYEFLGNAVESWIVCVIIIIATVAAVKLLSIFLKKVIAPLVKRTSNGVDDIVYHSLAAPVRFALALLGVWVAIHRLVYPDSFVSVIDKIYTVLIVLDITWLVVRLVAGLLENYWSRSTFGQNNKMMPIVRRAVVIVAWTIGCVVALGNVGVNVSALLGTLGIGGIAFALAAQDTVKNAFGAFTIFADRPFGLGDIIRIDGIEGTVIDVGIRSTRVMGYDRRIVSIPNYKVMDTPLVNISSEPGRRVTVKLGLTYDTSPAQMLRALEILKALPGRVDNVSSASDDVVAYFSEYADSALVITYFYYIEKSGSILAVMSDMNVAILKAFNDAGLEFAFPTHTVNVVPAVNRGVVGLG